MRVASFKVRVHKNSDVQGLRNLGLPLLLAKLRMLPSLQTHVIICREGHESGHLQDQELHVFALRRKWDP